MRYTVSAAPPACGPPGEGLLALTEFAEKPDLEYAREHLRVEGIAENMFLTVFGQYVLSPEDLWLSGGGTSSATSGSGASSNSPRASIVSAKKTAYSATL